MGTHHGGNDGNTPPDGDRPPDPELPELPPEWGEISIPDDPSELAREAEQVREELSRQAQPGAPGARTGPGARRPTGDPEPSIGVPLVIMSVAVLITLVSLFAMAWSGTGSLPPDGSAAGDGPDDLAPVTLVDASGRQVALTTQVPITIMLVEECGCAGLVAATAAAAPPGVTVAMVGYTAPPAPAGLAPTDPVPLRLADPSSLIRNQLGLGRPATGEVTVVLVDRDRQIVLAQEDATSVAQYQTELTALGR